MALSEFEIKKIERAVSAFMDRRRPPPRIRSQVDFGYRIMGQSVELFEIRPRWDKPEETIEHPIAKATYVKSSGVWKVFWKRADMRWHRYQPNRQVRSIEDFLALVDNDQYGCFFG